MACVKLEFARAESWQLQDDYGMGGKQLSNGSKKKEPGLEMAQKG